MKLLATITLFSSFIVALPAHKRSLGSLHRHPHQSLYNKHDYNDYQENYIPEYPDDYVPKYQQSYRENSDSSITSQNRNIYDHIYNHLEYEINGLRNDNLYHSDRFQSVQGPPPVQYEPEYPDNYRQSFKPLDEYGTTLNQ
ncbi:hypothetical protein BC833DRAFT_599229 [Globomyces pollinis-pini]|nr:hypothetical protein BC833DRAFT_599229 [Globomyces pollinis-pini]